MANVSSAETFYWMVAFLVGGGVPLITFITFWMTLSSRITEAQGMAKNAADEVEEARDNAAKGTAEVKSTAQFALAKIELVSTDLNLLKVDTTGRLSALTATVNATAKSLDAAENRIVRSIEDISRLVNTLSGTVTRTLAEMITKKL